MKNLALCLFFLAFAFSVNAQRKVTTRAEVDKLILESKSTGKRVDLKGANLRGVDLSGANLKGALLYGADLRDTNLSGTNLRDADLRRANFSGASMKRAYLEGADVRWSVGIQM